MGIGFTGLGIPDIGIDQVEEGLLLIIFEVLEVSEALEGLFIKPLVESFSHQVVEGHLEGIGDLFSGIDGGGGLPAFILADHDPRHAALSCQVGLVHALFLPQVSDDLTGIHIQKAILSCYF